jgi:hypothetical protein
MLPRKHIGTRLLQLTVQSGRTVASGDLSSVAEQFGRFVNLVRLRMGFPRFTIANATFRAYDRSNVLSDC